MTWSEVDDLTVASMASIINSAHESIGSNTGTPLQLASVTKTETEWGSLDPHVSVSNNSYLILQTALTSLTLAYGDDGKEVDLDGIYLEETVV